MEQTKDKLRILVSHSFSDTRMKFSWNPCRGYPFPRIFPLYLSYDHLISPLDLYETYDIVLFGRTLLFWMPWFVNRKMKFEWNIVLVSLSQELEILLFIYFSFNNFLFIVTQLNSKVNCTVAEKYNLYLRIKKK